MPTGPIMSAIKEQSNDPEPNKYLQASDYAWVAVFVFVVLVNLWLGVSNYSNAKKVSETTTIATQVMKWFADNETAREAGRLLLFDCNEPGGLWSNCLASIVAPGGPFENLSNQLEPTAKVFSDVCNRDDFSTLGSIVIERGSAKQADPSSIVYAKMPVAQDLGAKLPLKIYVCGRSFRPINVGEVVF